MLVSNYCLFLGLNGLQQVGAWLIRRMAGKAAAAYMGCSCGSATSCFKTSTAVGSCLWPRQNATSCRNRSDLSCKAAAAHTVGSTKVLARIHSMQVYKTANGSEPLIRASVADFPAKFLREKSVLYFSGREVDCAWSLLSSACTTCSAA